MNAVKPNAAAEARRKWDALGPFLLRKDADAITQARWLQTVLRPNLEDEAVSEILNIEGAAPSGEGFAFILAVEIADIMDIPRDVASASSKAAWKAAIARVQEVIEDVRKTVWPLAKSRAAGDEILAAARRVCDRSGVFIPTDAILLLCKKIALATIPQHVRGK